MISSLKKIYRFAGGMKGVLKKSVVFSCLYSVFETLQIFDLYLVIKGFFTGLSSRMILYVFLLLLASLIGKILCSYISDFAQTRVGYYMCAEK